MSSWACLIKDYTDEADLSWWVAPMAEELSFAILGDTDGGTFQLRTRAPGLPGAGDAAQMKWHDIDSQDWLTYLLVDSNTDKLVRFAPVRFQHVEIAVSGLGAAADFSIYAHSARIIQTNPTIRGQVNAP